MKLLFEMYKDKYLPNAEHFRENMKQYNLTREQSTTLYVSIHNYQLEKYGIRISRPVRKIKAN